MYSFPPMTFLDLLLQASAAVVLVVLCDLAKRHIKRAAFRRFGR